MFTGSLTRSLRSRSLLAALTVLTTAAGAAAQLRVVNYNIARLRGDDLELEAVLHALNEDPAPESGLIRVPDVYLFQEATSSSLTTLQRFLNDNAPEGVTYRVATFTENGGGGEQALLYRADTIAEDPSGHRDITNHTGPRATDRWKLTLVGQPDEFFFVYSSHFKADDTSAARSQRESEARAVRADGDALGEGAHIIYSGDFNTYDPNEEAYLVFFDPGAGIALDPSGYVNIWPDISHSQSPHDGTNNNLTTGGMDDRFDFQLSTDEFHDGAGFTMEPGSYRVFANDGAHFNQAINAGFNSYFRSDEQYKADAAARGSDHLPIIVDYFTPGDPFRLEADAMTAGNFTELRVTGATPNQMVYFIYSLTGLGSTPVSGLGVTLRLDAPALAGQARSDGAGAARLARIVPIQARGFDLWIQAAEFGATTDVVYREIF